MARDILSLISMVLRLSNELEDDGVGFKILSCVLIARRIRKSVKTTRRMRPATGGWEAGIGVTAWVGGLNICEEKKATRKLVAATPFVCTL